MHEGQSQSLRMTPSPDTTSSAVTPNGDRATDDPVLLKDETRETTPSSVTLMDRSKSPRGSESGLKDGSCSSGLDMKVQLAEAHSRVYNAFSRAFSRQNSQFEKAIRSLDSLNDQIVEFVLIEGGGSHGLSGPLNEDAFQAKGDEIERKQRAALGPAVGLMRRLLLDAQIKFRKMVEENQQLAARIDGELETAHKEVDILRQELADTNRRISEMQVNSNGTASAEEGAADVDEKKHSSDAGVTKTKVETPLTNGEHADDPLAKNQLENELSSLRNENEHLVTKNQTLLKEMEGLRRRKSNFRKSKSESEAANENADEEDEKEPEISDEENLTVSQLTLELSHAKEALVALKNDRKRLKSEKFDLLNQMKQLYSTLEDKENELREFIRNYEQRMRESDESLRQLAAERDESEKEKWNLLKHARDEAERALSLSTQLGMKDASIRRLEDELEMVRKQMSSLGYGLDTDSNRGLLTNAPLPTFTPISSPLPVSTPSATTPTCSPLPHSTGTSTTNGRGSSADSGVRFSSDKESTASHEGGPSTPNKDNSGSAIYAIPTTLSEERMASITPAVSATPIYAYSSNAIPQAQNGVAISCNNTTNLTSVGGNSGGLSRSAEQLCEAVAEAAESTPKGNRLGTMTLTRKSHKGNSTWGSISRVFARQKKRAALDASAYDGKSNDKRASWSPSSSLCTSPLTEESYSEKLRLLEEAQHIPLERWKAQTVLAWLEITLGMPQYGAMCAENVRSGKVLLELSDSELESGLGISHPMHRKKIRLAIEELREPRMRRFAKISVLGHTWVTSEWLPDLGLSQYAEPFATNLVDGRMLEALTKKELEKYLGVTRKFHQASIINGVHLLRIVRFDRHLLAERRRQCESADCDPVVWTNYRWYRWARSIDLFEYADNLKESGVHGALVVLEHSFSAETMATALGIPSSKSIIRRHLATEFENLVFPARKQMEAHAKFAKMERRRQEKISSGGSLGRSFGRSYGTLQDRAEKEKRRSSLRGSLSRALGIRLRDEIDNKADDLSTSPSISSTIIPSHPSLRCLPYQVKAQTPLPYPPEIRHPHAGVLPQRPRSSVVPSSVAPIYSQPRDTHRRVRSISDIEHMQAVQTPV